jgi:hypothetical protein
MSNASITVTDNGVTITAGVPSGNIGVPGGGTTNQVLTKSSNSDYDIGWASPSGTTAAPVPIAGSGSTLGTWRMLVSADSATISLPPSGTWAYILMSQKTSNNQVDILGASVAAGNTQLGSGISGSHYHLICWRVT